MYVMTSYEVWLCEGEFISNSTDKSSNFLFRKTKKCFTIFNKYKLFIVGRLCYANQEIKYLRNYFSGLLQIETLFGY